MERREICHVITFRALMDRVAEEARRVGAHPDDAMALFVQEVLPENMEKAEAVLKHARGREPPAKRVRRTYNRTRVARPSRALPLPVAIPASLPPDAPPESVNRQEQNRRLSGYIQQQGAEFNAMRERVAAALGRINSELIPQVQEQGGLIGGFDKMTPHDMTCYSKAGRRRTSSHYQPADYFGKYLDKIEGEGCPRKLVEMCREAFPHGTTTDVLRDWLARRKPKVPGRLRIFAGYLAHIVSDKPPLRLTPEQRRLMIDAWELQSAAFFALADDMHWPGAVNRLPNHYVCMKVGRMFGWNEWAALHASYSTQLHAQITESRWGKVCEILGWIPEEEEI